MLEQGAVACLFKPFSDAALLEALNAALRAHDLSGMPCTRPQGGTMLAADLPMTEVVVHVSPHADRVRC